jgi:hypothetical protein
MVINKVLLINRPANEVWEVLGPQFGEIDKWSSLIHKSEVSGEAKLTGVSYSVRNTETTQGPTKQELTSFDPNNYTLSYKAIAGIPFFIKNIHAKWSLKEINSKETKLILDMNIETAGLIGMVLTPVVKLKLSKLANELLDDFKYYVENGKPHSRKLQSTIKAD